MAVLFDTDQDYIDLGDSEDEKAESSEDEIDIILHGTPEQRRHLQHQKRPKARKKGSLPESEDEFEKMLNDELNEKVTVLENKRVNMKAADSNSMNQVESSDRNIDNQPGETVPSNQSLQEKFYDDIYFDSDEELDNKATRQRHPVIPNDDLLYDPDMDARDEQWVNDQLARHQPRQSASNAADGQKQPLPPRSDAVLDCPACMTTLCRDCQRHDCYKNQYRAMFVMNCVVDMSQTLQYPAHGNKTKQSRKRKQNQQCVSEEKDLANEKSTYHPVKCQECNTVVAVYDSEEVYHFFNILASYS